MENTLIVITVLVALAVLAVVFLVSWIRYLIKDTLLSLILCLVLSISICALEIALILLKVNTDHSYIPAFNACVYGVNALFAAFLLVDRFGRKKNVEVTKKIIDTDESNDNEDE